MPHASNISTDNLQGFIKNARQTGIIMIIIGLVGILIPNLISLTLNAFIGSIFLFSAVVLAYIAWKSNYQSLSLWFKPFVLFALALLVLFHPAVLLSVLGLLLAIYFLLAGFSGITFAFEIKPAKGWIFMLMNGFLSFALGAIVLFSWPLSSSAIIGLLIGISFFFDGLTLVMISQKAGSVDTHN
jgi:uncharacterized membrane protein HdeD (DUF308 family)